MSLFDIEFFLQFSTLCCSVRIFHPDTRSIPYFWHASHGQAGLHFSLLTAHICTFISNVVKPAASEVISRKDMVKKRLLTAIGANPEVSIGRRWLVAEHFLNICLCVCDSCWYGMIIRRRWLAAGLRCTSSAEWLTGLFSFATMKGAQGALSLAGRAVWIVLGQECFRVLLAV